MPHFGKTLGELLSASRISKTKFSESIGYQPSNIYKLLAKESVDLDLMQTCCRVLKVSPLVFLDEDILGNELPLEKSQYSNSAVLGKAVMNIGVIEDLNTLRTLIAEKEKQIAEKDKQIADKERFIQYLLKEKPLG